MAMPKLDFKKLGTKMAGFAGGNLASNALDKTLSKANDKGEPMLSPMYRGLVMLGLGVLAPSFMGGKNDLVNAAGDSIANRGVGTLLTEIMAKKDGVSGADDEEINGTDDYDMVGLNGITDTSQQNPVFGTELDQNPRF